MLSVKTRNQANGTCLIFLIVIIDLEQNNIVIPLDDFSLLILNHVQVHLPGNLWINGKGGGKLRTLISRHKIQCRFGHDENKKSQHILIISFCQCSCFKRQIRAHFNSIYLQIYPHFGLFKLLPQSSSLLIIIFKTES